MKSRSRFPPFLPGLLFAATYVFFVSAACCGPFEKNMDSGIFGENPKKKSCSRQAASSKNLRQRLGREEAKVAGLEKKVLDLRAMAWGRGSGRLDGFASWLVLCKRVADE